MLQSTETDECVLVEYRHEKKASQAILRNARRHSSRSYPAAESQAKMAAAALAVEASGPLGRRMLKSSSRYSRCVMNFPSIIEHHVNYRHCSSTAALPRAPATASSAEPRRSNIGVGLAGGAWRAAGARFVHSTARGDHWSLRGICRFGLATLQRYRDVLSSYDCTATVGDTPTTSRCLLCLYHAARPSAFPGS